MQIDGPFSHHKFPQNICTQLNRLLPFYDLQMSLQTSTEKSCWDEGRDKNVNEVAIVNSK